MESKFSSKKYAGATGAMLVVVTALAASAQKSNSKSHSAVGIGKSSSRGTVTQSNGFSGKLAEVDTSASITKGLQDFDPPVFLGINSQSEAMFLLDDGDQSDGISRGTIFWFDVNSGRMVRRVTSSRFEVDYCHLSPDGERIFTTDNFDVLPEGDVHRHDLLVLDSRNLKVLKRMMTKPKITIYQPGFVSGNPEEVVLPVLESTWSEKYKDYMGDYRTGAMVQIWNWRTAKKVRTFRYIEAPLITDMAFSPNRKYILCFFQNEPGVLDPHGYIDILNSTTGKILWHIIGGEKAPAGQPYTYISGTKFMCKNAIYDLATKRHAPVRVNGHAAALVGGVPGHVGKVLVLDKGGLALWDWPKRREIHRWANIKKADDAHFSPDLKTMVIRIEKKNLYQFWKFDPSWVK